MTTAQTEQTTAAPGVGAEALVGRLGCKDLDPNWPGPDGRTRGPVLCVLYPRCECGCMDGHREGVFRYWAEGHP